MSLKALVVPEVTAQHFYTLVGIQKQLAVDVSFGRFWFVIIIIVHTLMIMHVWLVLSKLGCPFQHHACLLCDKWHLHLIEEYVDYLLASPIKYLVYGVLGHINRVRIL